MKELKPDPRRGKRPPLLHSGGKEGMLDLEKKKKKKIEGKE